jgi:D-3-phosphoglycerate dehydrogenase
MSKIFYLGNRNMQPWYDTLIEQLPRGDVTTYEKSRPLAEQIESAELIVEDGSTRITKDVVDGAKSVRFIQRYGTGMDHMDVPYVLSKGIIVANTPGQFSGIALGEHAILLMLSLAKRTSEWDESVQKRAIAVPCGDELQGKVLGILGLGASGSHLAKLARAFGMRVLALDVRPLPPAMVNELGLSFFGGLDSMDRVLAESDYFSVHVPLTGKTRGMIGKHEFGMMKRDSRIINVARGPIIDEGALIEALRAGRIAAAGLDVSSAEPIDTENPLLKMKNVVFSPHVAGCTVETAKRRAAVVGENVSRFNRGLEPLYRITQPD